VSTIQNCQKGDEMSLKGMVSVITGAVSGIGRSTALLFAKEGSRIVVVDIVAETMATALRSIDRYDG
jgi:NAD(P)-dependent dehydrogenase (short-subunit alcohol dehydrogenase family)